MNFRHLEVFYAVMVNGTVTAAAQQLGVSQPSVTTTLKQAEAKLGVQLFLREGGRLVPTEEARILFKEAERAHESLAALTIMARGMTLGLGGHVRIASVPCLATELLPSAITEFEGRHTGFQYSVATMNTEEIVGHLDLRVGDFDLGFTLGQVQDTSLAFSEIGMVPLLAVLPADWGLPAGPEVDLAQLVEQPYIAGFDSTALGIASNRLFADKDVVPNTIARSHAHSVAGALVGRGLGFAFLDLFTVHSLLQGPDRDRITVREVAGADALPVIAAYPSRRKLSNAAAVFIECFQDAFALLEREASKRIAAACAPMDP